MRKREYYNELYASFQQLLDDYNPCEFNSEGECRRYQSGMRWGDDDKACCGGCNHLSDKGCKVKSLWCKGWLCGWVRDQMPCGFLLQWRHLNDLLMHEGWNGYRLGQEATMKGVINGNQ